MKITCNKCNQEMKKVTLDRYEYLEGFPLLKVPAYQCTKCENLFFTEEMIDTLEERTKELRATVFGFERTISTSGGGLVVRIPPDLVDYLDLKEQEKVRLIPVAHSGFLVEKKDAL